MWFPPVPKFHRKKKTKESFQTSLLRLITDYNFSIEDLKTMKLTTFITLIQWISKDNKEREQEQKSKHR